MFRRTAIAVALATMLVACSGDESATPDPTGTSAAPAATDRLAAVVTYDVDRAVHVLEDVTYPQTPPVGGDHNPEWQNCGAYREPVPDERAVHSLEHGAVWLTYAPGASEADIAAIEALATGQTHVLVSPHETQTSPFAASAWGTQLLLDALDIKTLQAFIGTYQRGAQTPEPGAPCSGAVGTPA